MNAGLLLACGENCAQGSGQFLFRIHSNFYSFNIIFFFNTLCSSFIFPWRSFLSRNYQLHSWPTRNIALSEVYKMLQILKWKVSKKNMDYSIWIIKEKLLFYLLETNFQQIYVSTNGK